MSTGSTFSDFVICNTAIILGITKLAQSFKSIPPENVTKSNVF